MIKHILKFFGLIKRSEVVDLLNYLNLLNSALGACGYGHRALDKTIERVEKLL